MRYIDIADIESRVYLETESEKVELVPAEGNCGYRDVWVELVREEGLAVYLTAEDTPVCRVYLSWEAEGVAGARIYGDAWERGYGDLEWRGLAPERVMPWYALVWDGERTCGYGVETGCAAMCSWRLDEERLTLCLDVRNGGGGVVLRGRRLRMALAVSREGAPGETPFEAAKAFCRIMCRRPRLPREAIYGGNNWYYAYGDSSREQILRDAWLLAELTRGLLPRPYMVIDDGWQVCHNDSCNGGPWDRGNYRFPDMRALAGEMKALGVRPGIWLRPLLTYECYPRECYSARKTRESGKVLDPSHPYVLERVEETVRDIAGWGYELIKHDFTTFDVFGRWGFQMGGELTDPDWHFYDRTVTTAEVILALYRAIRRGAGEDAAVIGCNTVPHLAAGLFEIQRTGDDTSGVEWERTRKMGVNTLAFRMPENGTFFASDADCAGLTGRIDWARNREWVELLSLSGTPLFLSVDPDRVTEKQKDFLRAAFTAAVAVKQEAVPLNWLDTTCPTVWDTERGVMTFRFSNEI